MNLVEEFTYRAELKLPVNVGPGPLGSRLFFAVVGGSLTGKRVNGRVLGGGGDWMLIDGDGLGRMDLRALLETDDGAVIYTQHQGLLELNEAVRQAMFVGDLETAYADHYFRTSPRFETGDPRYGWLNKCVLVSQGRFLPGPGVEHSVYRLT
jgi:hypothetical protein